MVCLCNSLKKSGGVKQFCLQKSKILIQIFRNLFIARIRKFDGRFISSFYNNVLCVYWYIKSLYLCMEHSCVNVLYHVHTLKRSTTSHARRCRNAKRFARNVSCSKRCVAFQTPWTNLDFLFNRVLSEFSSDGKH